MTEGDKHVAENSIYLDVERNGDLVLKLFIAYYRTSNHKGKMYDESPNFFLVNPQVLENRSIAVRNSDKLLLSDYIQRAKERGGNLGVSKFRNPKLGYYWLELSVMPFMLGDPVSKDNKGEFFFILNKFIEYSKQHPNLYGDLTAEMDSDKDIALMLSGISNIANQLSTSIKIYPEKMLLSYDPEWPVAEVKKLLLSLKDNDQDWCELFFEYLIYIMGKNS